MKTFERVCITDYRIPTGNNESGASQYFRLLKDKTYLTSAVSNGKVVVFSTYWVTVPIEIFAGEKEFTK